VKILNFMEDSSFKIFNNVLKMEGQEIVLAKIDFW
jgi:hypothetical protein